MLLLESVLKKKTPKKDRQNYGRVYLVTLEYFKLYSWFLDQTR